MEGLRVRFGFGSAFGSAGGLSRLEGPRVRVGFGVWFRQPVAGCWHLENETMINLLNFECRICQFGFGIQNLNDL